jgi:hypothetical protein
MTEGINPLTTATRWTRQPERLRSLTWEQLTQKGMSGTRRLQVVNDFRRHGIAVGVRLDAAAVARRYGADWCRESVARHGALTLTYAVPHPQSYIAHGAGEEYADEVLALTADWQDVSLMVAYHLLFRQGGDPTLGAAYVEDAYGYQRGPEGEKVLVWQPRRVGFARLLEFRGPGDVSGGLPRSAGGVTLTRWERPEAGDIPDLAEGEAFDAVDPTRAAGGDDDEAEIGPTDAEIAATVAKNRRR